MSSTALEPDEGAFDAFHDGLALVGANGFAQAGAGPLFPQPGFHPVEVLDLPHDPTRRLGRLFQGFVELAPHMRPTSGQFNGSVSLVGKGTVSGVTVALHGAGKINRDDVVQALGGTAGFPAVKHIASGAAARPQITLLGLSMSGLQIIHRRFVHLHIAAAHDSGADLFINGFQPFRRQFHPPGQTLARQVNSVALGVNLFLPV